MKIISIIIYLSLFFFEPFSTLTHAIYYILILSSLIIQQRIKTFISLLIFQIHSINFILRNILFHFLFISIIFLYSFIGSCIIYSSKKLKIDINIEQFPKILAKHLLFLCKYLLKIEVTLKGAIPKNAIIAPEHQSFLEIIALTAYLDNTIFIFKDWFLSIPFLGYCMLNLKMIPVYPGQHKTKWKKQAIEQLNKGKNIIIFPEGTRVPYNSNPKYYQGVFILAAQTNRKIIPVQLNSGLFWPKNAFFKHPGLCIIKFGKPINPNIIEFKNAIQSMKKESTKHEQK